MNASSVAPSAHQNVCAKASAIAGATRSRAAAGMLLDRAEAVAARGRDLVRDLVLQDHGEQGGAERAADALDDVQRASSRAASGRASSVW